MTKSKYVLAVGSAHNSRLLKGIFLKEGWQAKSVTNLVDAVRFADNMEEVPEYMFIDTLKDWVIKLAKELHSRGTQIRLYGFLRESREGLSAKLGVPYYSTIGNPWKAAGVLLDKEFSDEEMNRPLFPRAEIRMMEGSVFDKDLQIELGLDGLIVFRRHGFNPMEVYTQAYLQNQPPELVDKTVVWSFGRDPNESLVKQKVAELLSDVSEKGGSIIGISQIPFSDEAGNTIDDKRADEMLFGIVDKFMSNNASLLPIKRIYILIDIRCKPITSR